MKQLNEQRHEGETLISVNKFNWGRPLYRAAMFFMVLFSWMYHPVNAQGYGPPTRYEAENGFNSNVVTSSANAGYSGSGYVTGLITNNSETKFDKGVSTTTPTKVDIRYANGTGGDITNLALYIGSNQKIQDLVFPSTGSWSTWGVITITFNHSPSWGSNIIIKSTSNVATSVNIDYTDLSISDGSVSTVATPTFSPVAGTYTSAQLVTISTATAGAELRYTTNGSTPTAASGLYTGAINVASTATVKAIGIKSGFTNSAVASATYTISTPPPAPGAFTQTSPASGATGVSRTPAFSWGASSNAASYTLVVATNSNFTSPAINQSGLTGTSYTPSAQLAATTLHYWKVTAVNSTGTTVASNSGISFTTDEGSQGFGTPTRYEAENGFNANVNTSSANAGYSGSGYITGITTTNSETKFDKGVSALTPTKLDIRYANGTGADITNLALHVGSNQKIQDLVFPSTGSWGTWGTITVLFNHDPSWGSNIIIKSTANVSTSVNIDYTDLSVGDGTISTVAAPTFSPVAGTYTSAQLVTLSTATAGAEIRYTTNGSTPTAASALYTAAINVGATTTIKAIGIKSGFASSAVASATYTITTPPPAPGAFTQTSPASGATDVSRTPAFSWAASSNAASYTLVVATNSNFTSPAINQSGITATTYTPSAQLAATTLHYWMVTAVNSTGSTVASNTGISFTTGAGTPPPPAQAGVIREVWTGISGTAISNLTGNANYPNNPTSTSVISNLDAPREVGENYGQRLKGYLAPTVTGSYKFWISADDDAELWLSNNSDPNNKVKIASLVGWTYPLVWDKYSTQASANINLTAGNYYYIEVLHKENDGGDHVEVAWQVPGGSVVVIPGTFLVTSPPVPLPVPGAFNLTAPANGATGVALSPTFSWGASSDAATYTLVVAANSAYTSPVINQSGITGTSYTSGGLSGTTTYYWKVTAVNASGTKVATNAGISFTTLTPPAPGAFTQTAPASGATSVSRNTSFTWAASSNASTYSLVVSTSNTYANPVINQSGLTTNSFSPATLLSGSTLYYWKVTATNSTGSTVATNAGISFTTSATTGTYYHVSPSGVDQVGRGSEGSPFKTVAYAAKQVPANQNNTIYLTAGTYYETEAVILPLGVNIEGAGEANVTVTSNGAIPPPSGVDAGSGNYHLWPEGSIIQLVSPIYNNPENPKYGSPSQMIAAENGNQMLSGFTLDGNAKKIKAGLWVENRNNVTVHHITFRNFNINGAVLSRGDMWWYEPIPAGKWMQNTKAYNLTFTNCAKDGVSGGSSGNLSIGGLDGADIFNITINENQGYGIKFKHVGHFRNVKVHDCNITVPETDSDWGEDISIEMWNFSYDNEIYNIVCNTWLSLVNHVQFNDYQPTTANPSNLKVRNVRMIDNDGNSGKEAIECALSGVEISDSYIQDKGFGIAIWGGAGWGGSVAIHNININNNIFANVNRSVQYGFGNSSAVFVPDAANTIKIQNNVFDKMGNGLQLDKASGVSIKNNVFINSGGDDVQGGSSLTFTNNLRYNTNAQKPNWQVSTTVNSTNIQGNPGFQNSGSRWDTYYMPASGTSLVVDKGTDVGIPYYGSAPDIGRWEWTGSNLKSANIAELGAGQKDAGGDVSIIVSPNPTKGVVRITSQAGVVIGQIQVINPQGRVIVDKLVDASGDIELNLSQFSSDMYILKVKHQGGVITRKIMVLK